MSGHGEFRYMTQAITGLNEGLEIAESIAPKGDLVSQIHRLFAEVYLHLSDIGTSNWHADKGFAVASALGEQYELGVLHWVLGEVAEREGDRTRAEAEFETSGKTFVKIVAHYGLERLFSLRLADRMR